MQSILVIGAGIAGLLAAQELQKCGFDVTVIDKGRGLGGRLATRRLEVGGRTGKADHGAQYITAYEPKFEALIQEMERNGALRVWGTSLSSVGQTKRPRYIAPEGMTAVAKYCAKGLTVRLGERVISLMSAAEGGWKVQTDKEASIHADAILITAPVPQALMLVDTLAHEVLSAEERMSLEAIQYEPSIALMLALLEGKTSQVKPPGMVFVGGGSVMWIADNQQKGISPDVATLTIHTTSSFAREHWETREEDLVPLLLADVHPYLSMDSIASYSLHRWRYSRVTAPHDGLFLAAAGSAAPLIFAGDAFAGITPLLTRVEDAALSGWAAAEYLSSLGT
jgi:renalase